jgi:hypothetical protein
MPVVTAYCGVDSAELGRNRTGDLGRCETAASMGVETAASARYALTWWERIGVASAAERVNVMDLD